MGTTGSLARDVWFYISFFIAKKSLGGPANFKNIYFWIFLSAVVSLIFCQTGICVLHIFDSLQNSSLIRGLRGQKYSNND